MHTFPIVLKNIDKSVSFKEIVDLPNGHSVLEFIIEKEVNHFGYRDLQQKKDYLTKNFKIGDEAAIWSQDGNELWKEIQRQRHAIVHSDAPINISDEDLNSALLYFQRTMFLIALYSQKDHGVPFQFGGPNGMQNYIQRKDSAEL